MVAPPFMALFTALLLCGTIPSVATLKVATLPAPMPSELSGVSLAENAMSLSKQRKILLFWACGSKDNVVDLIKANIKHARKELGKSHVHVYLVHYDMKSGNWQSRAGRKWYKNQVDFSVNLQGYKTELMQQLLGTGDFDLTAYDWVWSLDEDVDFTKTNLKRMLATANQSGSLIALPAFTEVKDEAGDYMSFGFQAPRRECKYRYVPMLEAIFPLIRPEVLAVLNDCDHCVHKHSVWGMCRVWCAWSAKRLGKPRATACAVLDQDTVVHKNFKTLNGKYSSVGTKWEDPEWISQSQADQEDVKLHHLDEFVSWQVTPQDWTCVDAQGKVKHTKTQSNITSEHVRDFLKSMDEVKKAKAKSRLGMYR